MTRITLSRGYVALVDDADYQRLSAYIWHAVVCKSGHVYAARHEYGTGKKVSVLMHREIIGAAVGKVVDHRDGNTLNNTRSNLRECTHGQNHQNRRRFPARSGFNGVSSTGAAKLPWRASIKLDLRKRHLGRFSTAAQAAKAYDAAAIVLFGEFAATNQSLGLL